MLQKIKKKYLEEQESISRIKRLFPHLSEMNKDELLVYFNCVTSNDLIEISHSLCKTSLLSHVNNKEEVICRCRDANGIPKTLYATYDEAEKVQTYVFGERKVKLNIYPCTTVEGWHLSKI